MPTTIPSSILLWSSGGAQRFNLGKTPISEPYNPIQGHNYMYGAGNRRTLFQGAPKQEFVGAGTAYKLVPISLTVTKDSVTVYADLEGGSVKLEIFDSSDVSLGSVTLTATTRSVENGDITSLDPLEVAYLNVTLINVTSVKMYAVQAFEVALTSLGSAGSMEAWALAAGATKLFKFEDLTESIGAAHTLTLFSGTTVGLSSAVQGCTGKLDFGGVRTRRALPNLPTMAIAANTNVSIVMVLHKTHAFPGGACTNMIGGTNGGTGNPADMGNDNVADRFTIADGDTPATLVARLSSLVSNDIVLAVSTMSGTTQTGFLESTTQSTTGSVTRAVGAAGGPVWFSGDNAFYFTNASFDLCFWALFQGTVLGASDVAAAKAVLGI